MMTPRETINKAQAALVAEHDALEQVFKENTRLTAENKALSEECCRRARREKELDRYVEGTRGVEKQVAELASWIYNNRPGRMLGGGAVDVAIETMRFDKMRVEALEGTAQARGNEIERLNKEVAECRRQLELEQQQTKYLGDELVKACTITQDRKKLDFARLYGGIPNPSFLEEKVTQLQCENSVFRAEINRVLEGWYRAEAQLAAIRRTAAPIATIVFTNSAGTPCSGPSCENGEVDAASRR